MAYARARDRADLSLDFVIDMNLPASWADFLEENGHRATHWRNIGHIEALDSEIMEWARQNNRIVFTQDLDFSRMLALSGARGPSIFQIRNTDNLPEALGSMVLRALKQCEQLLGEGAIVVINHNGTRARFLPLR